MSGVGGGGALSRLGRALQRFRQPLAIMLGTETSLAPPPLVLFRFAGEANLRRWAAVSDAAFGGRSTAAFSLAPGPPPAAVFAGTYDADLGDDDGGGAAAAAAEAAPQSPEAAAAAEAAAEAGAELKRAGFAAVASKVLRVGDVFNVEPYDRMVYELRGDGKTYVANLRLESYTGDGGDLWQAPLRTAPGVWQRTEVPLRAFVPTHKGRLVARASEMPRDRILSFGFAVSAADNEAAAAPFRLEIREIRAESSLRRPADAPGAA